MIGIFYQMVNLGASFGPIVMGKLRVISWNVAFMAGAVAIGVMLLFTIFFYKEPRREIEGVTLGKKFKAIPAFLTGLFVAALGFGVIGYARLASPSFLFLGLFLFAVGEMASSPRIQEYITWIAPKEKAGLYMGCNFIALLIGSALSGVTYTTLYGVFDRMGHPEYLWWTAGIHLFVGMFLISWFIKKAGEFKERSE